MMKCNNKGVTTAMSSVIAIASGVGSSREVVQPEDCDQDIVVLSATSVIMQKRAGRLGVPSAASESVIMYEELQNLTPTSQFYIGFYARRIL